MTTVINFRRFSAIAGTLTVLLGVGWASAQQPWDRPTMTPSGFAAQGNVVPGPTSPGMIGPGSGASEGFAPMPGGPEMVGAGPVVPGAWADGETTLFGLHWDIDVGGVFLSRSLAHDTTLIFDNANGQRVGVGDFDLGWAAGPRLSITGHTPNYDLDFAYFSIDGWSVSRGITDPGNLTVPALPGFVFDVASAAYTSKLYSAEGNFKYHLNNRCNALIGLRWVELDDVFLAAVGGTPISGTAKINSANDLFGVQLGGDGRFFDLPAGFHLDGFFKAGLYLGHVRNTSDTSPGVAALGLFTANDDFYRAAVLGETGVKITWDVSAHFGLFAGYEAMWIDGISLAPDVLTGVGDSTTVFYHGALGGGELRW